MFDVFLLRGKEEENGGILSHQLGCDIAHQALPRWTGLAWSHPGPFGPDLAKK